MWNEPPWTDDPWDAAGKFYGTVPAGVNNDSTMLVFRQYAITIDTLPSGVRILDSAAEKGLGCIAQVNPRSSQVAASLVADSFHTYSSTPENWLWAQSGSYVYLNPDYGSYYTCYPVLNAVPGQKNYTGILNPSLYAYNVLYSLAEPSDDNYYVADWSAMTARSRVGLC